MSFAGLDHSFVIPLHLSDNTRAAAGAISLCSLEVEIIIFLNSADAEKSCDF